MSKFKRDLFTPPKVNEPVQVGAGLLNTTSTEKAVERMEIEYIEINKIIPNKKNTLSMGNIEELAQFINLNNGLEQPLVVREEDEEGNYLLLTGHRRLAAIKLLQEQGKWHMDVVPCKVKNFNNIPLPLDDETKELFSILVTNRYRSKTDGDILSEIRDWKEIFTKLRAEGIEGLPIEIDEEGNSISELKIKGVRTRELIANQLDLSPAQVGRYETVENKGSEELVQALLNNEISLAKAESTLSEPKEEQIHSLEKTMLEKEKANICFDGSELTSDINSIRKQMEANVYLTDNEYKKYKKCIRQIESIMKK